MCKLELTGGSLEGIASPPLPPLDHTFKGFVFVWRRVPHGHGLETEGGIYDNMLPLYYFII